MKIDSIKKYIISLKRRQDRRDHMINEMKYMGWEYSFFDGIDTNSYEGCGRSHMAVAQLLLDSNDEHIIVFEDDIFFMPYAKTLLTKVEEALNNTEWDIFSFAPSIHRPLHKPEDILVTLSSTPPKDETRHRGIFGMSGYIYNRKVAEIITKWNTNEIIENSHLHNAIDQYMDIAIFPKFKSFCAKYPVVTQIDNYSDINKTNDRNHFLITYNWNQYIYPLPPSIMNYDYCLNLRNNNTDGLEI